MTLFIVLAYFSLFLAWGLDDVAVLNVLGFVHYPRIAELVGIMSHHVSLGARGNTALINLAEPSKTSAYRCFSVAWPGLVAELERVTRGRGAHETILQRSREQYRSSLHRAAEFFRLGDWGLRPYSWRRGGASTEFKISGSLSKVVDEGGWRDQRTARIYITTALLDANTARLEPATAARMQPFVAHALTVLHGIPRELGQLLH